MKCRSLIGFFVNTLVLRSEVNGDVSFDSLLQQVRATTLEAYEHQDVPFEKVVDIVLQERGQEQAPAFPGDVYFTEHARCFKS
jgi:non-ribosomal peptide synthetase component F